MVEKLISIVWRVKFHTLHIISPNTKSRNNVPTRVKGIQKTPSRISETAKFNKNTFVIVRIRRFCTSVIMTNAFPTMANSKMVAYNGIWSRPLASHSVHDVAAACIVVATVVVVVVVTVDTTMTALFVGKYCCWTWCWGNTDDSWWNVSLLSSVQVTFCKYGIKVAVSFGVIVFHTHTRTRIHTRFVENSNNRTHQNYLHINCMRFLNNMVQRLVSWYWNVNRI